MKIRLKKPLDVPAHIQALIDRVVASDSLADALDGFAWVYDKGDFSHWVALFNHFEDFFEKHVKSRGELLLEFPAEGAPQEAEPFPVADCLAILRTTSVLLENTMNKHLYQSYDHLANLLASPHPELVTATLQALLSFLKKTHHASIRWHGYREVNSRLIALCLGWGGKEEGLELAACSREDDSTLQQKLLKATTLHYEFFRDADGGAGAEGAEGGRDASRVVSIHVPNLHKLQESDLELLRQLVARFDVPPQHRFPLLAKIRVAQGFASLESRRQLVRVRLMAFCVVFQSNLPTEELQPLFQAEPELVGDLVTLVQADKGVPQDLRAFAVRALAVQMSDRARAATIVAAVSSRANGGVLSMLLHQAIASMVDQAKAVGDVVKIDTAAAPEAAAAAASASQPSAAAGASTAPAAASGSGGGGATLYTSDFVDAMLMLVSALVASSQGCSALADAGVIGALLPMLRNASPQHLGIVATTVKILEAFIDYSQPASTMFRDLNGLHEMIARLTHEAGVPSYVPPQEDEEGADAEAAADAAAAAADASAADDDAAGATGAAGAAGAEGAAGAAGDDAGGGSAGTSMETDTPGAGAAAAGSTDAAAGEAGADAADAAPATAELVPQPCIEFSPPPLPLPPMSRMQAEAAAVTPLPDVLVPYQRKVLMKFLLRAIAISSYAPSSGASIRPRDSDAVLLYRCLRAMFERADAFGGSLFALAASVVTDLLHHEPTIYRALDAAGLPQAFIDAVKDGVLPYGEAVVSVANTMVALCLNQSGMERVVKCRLMDCFVPIFTAKKYHKALGGETPAIIGAGIEELFRFVPQLRSDGIEAIVDILRTICVVGGDESQLERARSQQATRDAKHQAGGANAPDAAAPAAAAGAPNGTGAALPTLSELCATARAATAAAAAAAEAAAGSTSDAAASAASAAAAAEAAATEAVAAAAAAVAADAMDTDSSGAAGAAAGGDDGDGAAAGTPTMEADSGPGAASAIARLNADAAAALAEVGAVFQAGATGGPAAAAAAPAAAAGATAAAADAADTAREPYDLSHAYAEWSGGSVEAQAYLAESINHTTRMLESLLSNTENSNAFVQKDGIDLLLRLHSLPRLSYTFAFSSASHPLLAVFRGLAPQHAQLLSGAARDVLATQAGLQPPPDTIFLSY
ncbi:hypothetical protein FOA52_010442 [Chlamydomonas sp. UWO 241]|nr:hypothetical protein FOA52_010442 [Chlamydomonas sp. UWO 241]